MDEASVSEREEVARRNANALMQAFDETGMLVGVSEALDWRATWRSRGHVLGIDLNLTLIATDGSRGLFLVDDLSPKNYFLGHVEWFDGKVAPAHSVRKKKAAIDPTFAKVARTKKVKTKSKRATLLELL